MTHLPTPGNSFHNAINGVHCQALCKRDATACVTDVAHDATRTAWAPTDRTGLGHVDGAAGHRAALDIDVGIGK